MDKQVVISVKTILLTFLIGVAGYVVYKLGPIIGIILLALFLVIALEPGVEFLKKKHLFNKPIPRKVAVFGVYIIFILAIALVGTSIIPTFLSQLQKLLGGLGSMGEQLHITEDLSVSLTDLFPKSADVSSEILSVTISLFSNISIFVSVIVISLYISLDWINIKKRFYGILPDKTAETVEDTINEIEEKLGAWMKGELTLMFSIGLMSFVGLLLLDINYPLALGMVAGMLELVPTLGPLISAVLAGVVGFAESPVKGISAVVLFSVVQSLENNLLVPRIMGRVSGFSPIIVLIAILIGTKFFGIVGALLAVPMTMILTIILKKVLETNNQ